MILELTGVVVALVVVFLSIIHWKLTKNISLLKSFPGPKIVPVMGNGLSLSSDPCEIFKTLMSWNQMYGKRYRFFIGNKPFLLVSGSDVIEVLLSSAHLIDKSDDYNLLAHWLGYGLLLSTGGKWKSRRRIITPAFHFKILEQFIDVFNSSNDIFIKRLSKYANGKEFNVYPFITANAMDIICETAMGMSVNAQQEDDSDYVVAVRNMCNVVFQRMFSIYGIYDFIFNLTQDGRVQTKSLKILHDFTENVIKSRREKLLNSKSAEEETNEFGIRKKRAFLDVLLESTINGEPLTNLDIREEVDTFMFEGHDTVSSAIGAAFYCLSTNPEVQEKVFSELFEIFDHDKDRAATYSELQEMKYLELVIKEVLRLYPSVPFIGRDLSEDVSINGVVYPKNVSIILSLYAMHRDPEYFDDPETFNPDRFNNEHAVGRNPYVYVPFSAGPRNCIGQKFAMLEMKTTLSKVLRHYEILAGTEDLKLASAIILKSVNGINIKLKPRIYPN